MIVEMFPPVVVALNEEVRKHPLLLAELSKLEQTNGQLDMSMMTGAVAAYCGIGLDGYYLEEDLIILFHLLLSELQKRSAIVIH